MRLKLIIIVLAISVIPVIFSCSQCSEKFKEVKEKTKEVENAKELFEKARKSIEEGDYEKAVEYYDKLLEIKPDEGGLWYARGLGLFYQGKYGEGASSFERAIEFPEERWKLYAYIFLYIGRTADGDENINLIKPVIEGENKEWPYPAIQYLANEITEDELIETAGDDPGRLCEVHCYIGYMYKFADDKGSADEHFRASLETNKIDFVEYKLSQIELGLESD